MILLNPIGGLASQLHKYFIAIAIAKKYNTEVKFYLENNREIKDRPLELDKFNIDIQYPNRFEVFYFTKIQKRINRLKRKIGLLDTIDHFKNLMTYEHFSTIKNNTFINGEWILGDIYFKEMYNELQEKFQLKDEMSCEAKEIKKSILQTNSISIHFRRGDYLHKNCSELHGNLTLDYYYQALKMIEQQTDALVLFIFSDDIEWVKNNFITAHESYYINISTYEDIVLMATCKHNIIANSGYSWFASFFNTNPNKIIVAPKQWVLDNEINERITLYTDHSKWIRI